jgi:hypothetical protein
LAPDFLELFFLAFLVAISHQDKRKRAAPQALFAFRGNYFRENNVRIFLARINRINKIEFYFPHNSG